MTEDVAKIAAGLTKAQRGFLVENQPRCVETYKPFIALRDAGLMAGRTGRYGSHVVTITPAGVSVRNHLLTQSGEKSA